MRYGLPEIIDPVGLAGGHYVVVDGAHFGGSVFVFDESQGSHFCSGAYGYKIAKTLTAKGGKTARRKSRPSINHHLGSWPFRRLPRSAAGQGSRQAKWPNKA